MPTASLPAFPTDPVAWPGSSQNPSKLSSTNFWNTPRAREWPDKTASSSSERTNMRITVSHNRPKEELMQSVDRSFTDLFQGIGIIPVQLAQQHKSCQRSTLTFALTAQMGLISTPIKGTVAVSDRDLTIA